MPLYDIHSKYLRPSQVLPAVKMSAWLERSGLTSGRPRCLSAYKRSAANLGGQAFHRAVPCITDVHGGHLRAHKFSALPRLEEALRGRQHTSKKYEVAAKIWHCIANKLLPVANLTNEYPV